MVVPLFTGLLLVLHRLPVRLYVKFLVLHLSRERFHLFNVARWATVLSGWSLDRIRLVVPFCGNLLSPYGLWIN